MILITGATGTTGREVVSELRRLGANGVRALVRDPARADFIREAGFEAVAGDFERPETLGAALERLNELFASGGAAEVTDAVRRVVRREPATFARFARDHAAAFKGE